ncbi:hypothetical protein Ancab_019782 [Ancistrocladus abbreviatus]
MVAVAVSSPNVERGEGCGCGTGTGCNKDGYCRVEDAYRGSECQNGPCYNSTSKNVDVVYDIVKEMIYDATFICAHSILAISSNQIVDFLSKIGVKTEADTEALIQRLDDMESRDVLQHQAS